MKSLLFCEERTHFLRVRLALQVKLRTLKIGRGKLNLSSPENSIILP